MNKFTTKYRKMTNISGKVNDEFIKRMISHMSSKMFTSSVGSFDFGWTTVKVLGTPEP